MINVAATSRMYNRWVNPLQTIFREIWPYHRNLKLVSLIIYELIHKVVNSVTDFNMKRKFFWALRLKKTNFSEVIVRVSK